MNEMQSKPFSEQVKEAWKEGCKNGRDFALDREELRKEVANRVRKCRLEARMTQEEVSGKIGANSMTYKGYENCRSDIPLVYLVRIADLYSVSVDYLVGHSEEKRERAGNDMEERIAQLEKMVAKMTTRE